MKRLLPILALALIVAGCAEPEIKAADDNERVNINGRQRNELADMDGS